MTRRAVAAIGVVAMRDSDVLRRGQQGKVIWVHATRVLAFVVNVHAWRYLAAMQLERHTVRQSRLSIDAESAVVIAAGSEGASLPLPAA
jgi:hypothetical protein